MRRRQAIILKWPGGGYRPHLGKEIGPVLPSYAEAKAWVAEGQRADAMGVARAAPVPTGAGESVVMGRPLADNEIPMAEYNRLYEADDTTEAREMWWDYLMDYDTYNKAMYSGDDLDDEQEELRQNMERLARPHEQELEGRVVFRGEYARPELMELRPGDSYMLKAPTSTSLSLGTAGGFMVMGSALATEERGKPLNVSEGVTWEIHRPGMAKSILGNPNEREVLLMPHEQLEIVDVVDNPKLQIPIPELAALEAYGLEEYKLAAPKRHIVARVSPGPQGHPHTSPYADEGVPGGGGPTQEDVARARRAMAVAGQAPARQAPARGKRVGVGGGLRGRYRTRPDGRVEYVPPEIVVRGGEER